MRLSTALTILGFTLSFFTLAQPKFYGSTHFGGENDLGTLFSMDSDGNNYSLQYQGNFQLGAPYGKLVEVGNRVFYGVTDRDNFLRYGGIFMYDANADSLTIVHRFDEINGKSPQGTPVIASNGKMYGLTTSGGVNGYGVIYEYDTINNQYTKKHDLTITTGGFPTASFIEASNGKLYAVTSSGGVNNGGTIIEYDIVSDVLTKIHDFTSGFGLNPSGNLVERSGLLYGTTGIGGTSGGTLFQIDINTSLYTVLHQFTGTASSGSPMIASNDKLYGVTQETGVNFAGEVYEYDFTNSTLTILGTLNDLGLASGIGTLVEAGNGRLFGACYNGGSDGEGGIFEYNITTDLLTKHFDYTEETANGVEYESFVLGSDGLLYGVSQDGGAPRDGVLYAFDPTGLSYSELYAFGSNEAGSRPRFLLKSSSETIYGLTYQGGRSDDGTLYELDPISNERKTLASFDWEQTGNGPFYMMEASNGKIYGRTFRGGTFDRGVLFEFDPDSNLLVKKVDFSNSIGGIDGSILELNGVLYGNNRFGGAGFDGTIFAYNLASETLSVISVSPANISAPFGELAFYDGKFYGTSFFGGSNSLGTIYEYDPQLNVVNKKVDFTATTGSKPWSGLVVFNNKLWGTTSEGGVNGDGVLFEFDPQSNSYQIRLVFDENSTGRLPSGTLLAASNGKLYGSTTAGGVNNFGTLFEFDPVSNTVSVKYDFTEKTSAITQPLHLLEECTLPVFDQPGTLVQCSGTNVSVGINSTNANTFVWRKDGTILTGQTSDVLSFSNASVNDSGTYTCEMSNVCGVSSVTFDIEITSLVPASQTTDISCNGAEDGIIEFAATGGNGTIEGSLDGTNFQEQVFTDLSPGVYTIFLRDEIGCQASEVVEISEPDSIVRIGVEVRDAICNGDSTGDIVARYTGGTGILQYKLNEGTFQNTSNFLDIPAGTYDIAVRDSNGCILEESFTVNEPDDFEFSAIIFPVTCNGESDGGIEASVSGGTGPYEFSLDGVSFSSNSTFTELDGGDYILTVHDSLGCSAFQSLTIVEPDTLELSAQFNGTLIGLQATGGTIPYSFSSDGLTFQSNNEFLFENGTYTFQVRDANGCEANSEAVVVTALVLEKASRSYFYPNPAKHLLTFTSTETIVEARVINYQGKEYINLYSEAGLKNLQVDELPKGMYLLLLRTRKGLVSNHKLLKN